MSALRVGPVKSGRRIGRTAGVVALLAAVIGLVVFSTAAGASPADPDTPMWQGVEQITAMDVSITVNKDDSMRVVETIAYDFGSGYRHGIERIMPLKYPLSPSDVERLGGKPVDGVRYERVYPISDISVTSPTPGTPTDVDKIVSGAYTTLRIGDPNQTITGTHTYVIAYTLDQVINRTGGRDELYYNVSGGEWRTTIANATATVKTPGSIVASTCYRGPLRSTQLCDSGNGTVGTANATFTAKNLAIGDAFSVVVALPKGVLDTPRPVIKEVWSIQRAFSLTPATAAATGGVLAALFAGLGLLGFRVGRDRRYVGSAVDQQFGNESGAEERVPLFDREPITVEFTPPDGLPPGLVGTLLDEVAHPLDVSATIVDLAVRGFLRIEELPDEGLFSSVDYRMTRLDKDPSALRPYEQLLLTHLFASGPTVQLSDLKQHFRTKLAEVQQAMYRETIDQGWYLRRPDAQRLRWSGIGLVVFLGGVGLTVLLALKTTWALLGLAPAIAGLVLMVGAHKMPARTGRGTAAYRRILGFKEMFLAGEGDRQHWAEEQHLFSRYLPYAIVFGCTEKWAKTFASLASAGAVPADDVGWWISPRPFDWIIFSHTMDSFSTASSGQLAAAAPSSASAGGTSGFGGGGFSGGGFGGGGGGSW